MKRLLLLFAVVIMTISATSQTAIDSVKYQYTMKVELIESPTNTDPITADDYGYFQYRLSETINYNFPNKNKPKLKFKTKIRKIYIADLDNILGELMTEFPEFYLECKIYNVILDEQYMAWYKSGYKQTAIISEAHNPFDPSGWIPTN